MDLGLTGKRALVAAATRGLGYATAMELAREGAQVMICGRQAERLQEALYRAGQEDPRGRMMGVVADVTQPDDVAGLVEQAVAEMGGLDILVTNAAGTPGGTFESISRDTWKAAVDLTLMSSVYLIQEALPHLRQGNDPSILTVTSYSVKQPIPNLLLSNAIRPAVVGLTKTLSRELGPAGVRVNSILPGWTYTERVQEILAFNAEKNGTDVDTEMGKIVSAIPMGRMGQPEEFGRVAAFLVSPAASFINGAMLQVDGGRYEGML